MSAEQVAGAFAPNVSFKHDALMNGKRGTSSRYRGFKGVGMTFLSYGSDDVVIHTKQENTAIVKGRMENGRAWAANERKENALIVEDSDDSPLDQYERGTYLKVQFSPKTRPKSLKHISTESRVWETILRTRTAIGQVLIFDKALTDFKCKLTVIEADGQQHQLPVHPEFVFPHMVKRTPNFRFLNVVEFWEKNGSGTTIDPSHKRQDGIYLYWDCKALMKELSIETIRKNTRPNFPNILRDLVVVK